MIFNVRLCRDSLIDVSCYFLDVFLRTNFLIFVSFY